MKRAFCALATLLCLAACAHAFAQTTTTATLDQYVGVYRNDAIDMTDTITRSGDHLEARVDEQRNFTLYPSRPDHFFYRGVAAYVEFVRQGGRVVGLIHTQHGGQVPVYRLDAAGKPMATLIDPKYPPIHPLDDAALASYVGTYELYGQPIHISVSNGHVFSDIGTPPAIGEIYPSAKDAFFYEAVDAQITFQRDSKGAVNGLTLFQFGKQTSAPKSQSNR